MACWQCGAQTDGYHDCQAWKASQLQAENWALQERLKESSPKAPSGPLPTYSYGGSGYRSSNSPKYLWIWVVVIGFIVLGHFYLLDWAVRIGAIALAVFLLFKAFKFIQRRRNEKIRTPGPTAKPW